MKRWLLRLLIGTGMVAVLVLALALAAVAIGAGAAKDPLAATLADKLGIELSIATARADLGQCLRLKPAISLGGVAAGNPTGFHSRRFLLAESISAQVELWPLLRKNLRVRSIIIRKPRLVIERNARGQTNLEVVLRKLSREPGALAKTAADAQTSGARVAVSELSLRGGEILVGGPGSGKPPVSMLLDELDFRLLDFQPETKSRWELTARLFRGNNSRVRLSGRTGPFRPDSLPVEGEAQLAVAPDEIPASVRRAQFGKLLGAPGSRGRVRLGFSFKGDAYGVLRGHGRLSLSDILVGKDARHSLPLSGRALVEVSAARLMSDPVFRFNISQAEMQLGEGVWTGAAELDLRGSFLEGHTEGALKSVQINQMLSSFTEAGEKLFGILEAPAYSLRFAGRDSDELMDSLSGHASLRITKGRVAALDLLASIRRALETSRREAEATQGSTPFSSLAGALRVGQRKLELTGLTLESPVLNLTGQGTVGFDGSLALNLEVPVSGELSALIARLARLSPGSAVRLPVLVTGTLESPRVRPDVRSLAGRGVRGLVDSFLKRRPK